MSTRNPTALVTGHAGFIGRHVTRGLTLAGYDVSGIDIALGDADALELFRNDDTRYDVVVHCAAVVGGRTMIDGRPFELAAVDLELDAALWRYALRTRPGRVVYWSSSAAYPVRWQMHSERQLVEEDIDPHHEVQFQPDNTYGLVKLVGERMALEARAEGIGVTVFRPFSGYGEDQALDYPFPSFIDRAARRLDPFIVWGPGTQVRDFVHVDDIVGATLKALELGIDVTTNIATGRGVSFLELAELVTEAAGYTPVVETLEDKPVGVNYRVGSTYRLSEFYEPVVSLEEGIARALNVVR